MDRYSKVTNKNVREIVLLKALPCIWGKCAFCDYIDDNGNNIAEINKLNKEVLDNITGEFGVLEVINSGSCFEIPRESLEYIKKIIDEKKIKKLFLESHWCYKNRLQEMRDFFGIEIIFKIGVETFDNSFRNLVFNKNANFKTVDEFKSYIQKNWFTYNIIDYSSVEVDINQNYIISGTIGDIQNEGSYKSKLIKKNFIIKLGSGITDFEMSFEK